MKYPHMVKFDIAAYFNSIYHHDLVQWFSEINASSDDVEHFGQFLREANGGRSVDCLPHGIHPCKLIGSEFLKFVDNSMRLRSEVLLRFLDDFYLFSYNEEVINMDFVLTQQLLGEKGLSLNPAAKHVSDKEGLAEIVYRFAADGAYATEDQLFWMAKLSEEFLERTSRYRDILFAIHQHPNATDISRSKVLEILEQRFGMPELRYSTCVLESQTGSRGPQPSAHSPPPK